MALLQEATLDFFDLPRLSRMEKCRTPGALEVSNS